MNDSLKKQTNLDMLFSNYLKLLKLLQLLLNFLYIFHVLTL